MRNTLKTLMIGTATLAVTAGMGMAETIIIGNFGSPTPMQVARANKAFDAATGWEIEWRTFGSGTEVIAAMASGDVTIAELGSSPLAIGASQGVDLQLFMIAQGLGTAESLIAKEGSGIEKLEDLKGKKVAVPVGSTAHYSLMGGLTHVGIAESDVTIVNLPADQIAAAWDSGQVDAAFIWQPVQSQILQTGKFIVGADQTAQWGYPTFDGWVVNAEFAAANADKMAAFAKVMDDANKAYLANPDAWTADSAEVKTIAEVTGADPAQVPDILKGFTFIPLADQLGDAWLGGAVANMKTTADFLVKAGRIDTAIDDYAPYVNTTIAEAAK
ncbi:taurine ABC transporter substrate-binding protein (plasmid) [Gemmobacter aquarius]|uniref:Taurine ABC transporter substrate-binding protein n=1 Tax=Paragemmobacter aquarius TaxID=2169400 RepID=A0A2S0US17_9RHOB|nr:taurine ABC transporter substrate-binding protein [Gemmobacter aquarius]AWB50597.1 taurine ABC transporter substrate-binding protein [Gemmobacter aquarius]